MPRYFKRALALAAAVTAALAATLAYANMPGKEPLAGPAHATFTLNQMTAPTSTQCAGAEGGDVDVYITRTGGAWSGTIDDNGSMMVPYHLHGRVDLNGTLTIALNTGLGIFTGYMAITGDTEPAIDAHGPVKLLLMTTTWTPENAPKDMVGRAMLDLPLYSDGKKIFTELVANTEFTFDGTTGQFDGFLGQRLDRTVTQPDIAVEWNGMTC